MITLLFIIILLFLIFTRKEKFVDITKYKTNNYIFRDDFPNVIHKTLYEDTGNEIKVSEGINDAIESWIVNNPGYTIKLWDLNESREFLKLNFPPDVLKCFDSLKPYAFKSDFFRYCIIYKNGGWYSDIFQLCLKDNLLDDLRKNKKDDYFFYDRGADALGFLNCVQNCFFGARKNSKVLKLIIDETIMNTYNEQYGNHPIKTATGPCILGKVFKKLGYKNKDFIGYFYIENSMYPTGAYLYDFNNTRLIKHKCLNCKINNGNDYRIMWKNKDIYVK